MEASGPPRVLLTGATGYVGGRLLPVLEQTGVRVRCLARRPEYLAGRIRPDTEIVRGDCLDPASLPPALAHVHTAYYLVHSLGARGSFEEQDRRAARHFAAAAAAAGVRRIVYLGGLGDPGDGLSAHLRSRHETGDALRAAGVPVVEFRASIILGSGSLSYEMIRALVERLPVMLCPEWVRTPTQPIAIEDVVAYLRAALDLSSDRSHTFEIGGAERTSYAGIMQEYARQRGLRRLLIPVPVLTPSLSSLWLGLTTPIYARVGRKLVESLRNATVVRDDAALRVFPIRPMGLRRALARARIREDRALAATRWNDALSATCGPPSYGGVRFGSRLVDSRAVTVAVPPAVAFAPIRRIGGRTGWYAGHLLWRLRGFVDILVGGVGLRRGRRDPEHLAVGDALDCWRVVDYEPDSRLRLLAEMRLPGRAWLQFEVAPAPGGSTIRQTALFEPAGLSGLLYWYGIYPLHARVFRGMLRGIAAAAATWHEEACSASASSAAPPPGDGRPTPPPHGRSAPPSRAATSASSTAAARSG
jgi:uncharacterized protein YbjT (DUF2867 family)